MWSPGASRSTPALNTCQCSSNKSQPCSGGNAVNIQPVKEQQYIKKAPGLEGTKGIESSSAPARSSTLPHLQAQCREQGRSPELSSTWRVSVLKSKVIKERIIKDQSAYVRWGSWLPALRRQHVKASQSVVGGVLCMQRSSAGTPSIQTECAPKESWRMQTEHKGLSHPRSPAPLKRGVKALSNLNRLQPNVSSTQHLIHPTNRVQLHMKRDKKLWEMNPAGCWQSLQGLAPGE